MLEQQVEFRGALDSELKAIAFSSGVSDTAALAEFACKLLEDSNEIAAMDLASANLSVGPRRKRAKIDAFGFDEIDNTLYLLLAEPDVRTGSSTLTKSDADTLFAQLSWFVEVSLSDQLRADIPKYEEAAQFAWTISERWLGIQKVKLVLVTNKTLSGRVRTYETPDLFGKRVEAQIWDETRLFELSESKTGREATRVVLSEFGSEPIPMLAAETHPDGTSTYLAIVPGQTLAKIFDRFGSRLLEGNVRGFLSTRGSVNKGIRATILGQPEKFLIFNNGITATATGLETDETNRLLALEDLQIVNGGQTTASLYNFMKTEKVASTQLAQTMVAMKLIVVDAEISEELVPDIAKYSNSQNKVNEADFFANSPFHRRMEEISKRILAPAVGGRQVSTKWYYERARGSFENDRARAAQTSAGLRRFDDTYPKGQKIDKTDLAKFHSICHLKPYLARRGNQKNFLAFKDEVAPKFESETGREQFNDLYYKKIVCTKIIFDATHKAVRESPWYTQGYLADIVTYGVSKFLQVVADEGFGMPWETIWQRQSLPENLLAGIVECAELSLGALLDPTRRQQNVTEWAKSEDCWKSVKQASFVLTSDMRSELLTREIAQEAARESRETGRLMNELETLQYLAAIPFEYWEKLENKDLVRSPKQQACVKQIKEGQALLLDKGRASLAMELISKAFLEGIARPD